MPHITAKGLTIRKYLADERYNTWPTVTLAREIYRNHSDIMTSQRATVELVRAHRGQHNSKSARPTKPVDVKPKGYYADLHGYPWGGKV